MATFDPQVSEYMHVHGYEIQPSPVESIHHLLFRKGDIGVQFWKDRIEKICTRTGKVLTSFKGFDGRDIFQLMLALHVMKVIDLKEFVKECREHVEMFEFTWLETLLKGQEVEA